MGEYPINQFFNYLNLSTMDSFYLEKPNVYAVVCTGRGTVKINQNALYEFVARVSQIADPTALGDEVDQAIDSMLTGSSGEMTMADFRPSYLVMKEVSTFFKDLIIPE